MASSGRSVLAAILVAAMTSTLVAAAPPSAAEPAAAARLKQGVPSAHFAVIGDFGTNTSGAAAVADLVHAAEPDFIATVGDNACFDNTDDDAIGQYYADYIGAYHGAYGPGSEVNRFFPALGNHDHTDGGGLPAYLDYFTLPGAGIAQAHPSGNERYYDYVQGPVHFFVLDSYVAEPDGNTSGSVQATWLRNGLAATTSRWNVVMFHHAPYTSWSLPPGNKEALQWPFEDWGADLVLTGHVHTYERIVRDDNHDGVPLTYVVNGLGGQEIHQFDEVPVGGSQVRYNAQLGAQFFEATTSELTATFRSIDGVTQDRFTLADAAPRPDGLIRRSPTGVVHGDGVYNNTGVSQAVGGTTTGASVHYRITVQNDAPFPEVLRLRGTPSTAAFLVQYRVAGVDVTAAVTAGTYLTPVLESGDTLTLKAFVTPTDGARHGARIQSRLTVKSTTRPTSRDRVSFLTIRT